MADLCDMSLEKFRLWTDSSLKSFLALRKKSTEGTIDELAARAFIAWEERVPVNSESEHEERKLLQEYKAKLITNGEVIPDPFSLEDGWIGEESGIIKWPSVYITDIASYLNNNTPQELVNRVINEYKVGKAYRYYSCDWVKEVKYHGIRESSSLCILRAQVTPSMSVRSPCYHVWAVIAKSSPTVVGGNIVSAYCTCTAGMLGTCNHIAGLLFRIESAVVTGRTEKSCTELPCTWNIPRQRIPLKPIVATNVLWTKDHYSKRGNTPSRADCAKSKAAFTPLSGRQVQGAKKRSELRKELFNIASRCAPDARFYKMMKREPPIPPPVCPANIPTMVDSYQATYPNGQSEHFLEGLSFTEAQCLQLKTATVDQGTSLWKEQRKGRVTASSFHRVNSRMKTMEKDPTADPTPLVQHIMGYKDYNPTEPMKHGIACEPHAKMQYARNMRKTHQKFKCFNSGITTLQEKPYISASADLEVECNCCGKGLCEIKSPFSIKGQKPTVENLHFLEASNGKVKVKSNDQYFAQIQGQMAILNRTYCDLFVYTFHGNLCIRVQFDEEYWNDMLSRLDKFWIQYILPELFNKNNHFTKESVTPVPSTSTSTLPAVPLCSSKRKRTGPQKGCRKSRRKLKIAIHLCPVCGNDCVDDPATSQDQSAQCSSCAMWCHFHCGGVNMDSIPKEKDVWMCPKCR